MDLPFYRICRLPRGGEEKKEKKKKNARVGPACWSEERGSLARRTSGER